MANHPQSSAKNTVVIIGGVAVNDPTHDAFPYNFMNPAMKKAKALANSGRRVTVAIYAPAYEERVRSQTKEHSTVQIGSLTCGDYAIWNPYRIACNLNLASPPKDTSHFLNVARTSATNSKASYVEIRCAEALTSLLSNTKDLAGVYYFGHSNAESMFLEYSVSIAGRGTVTWGAEQAKKVPKSNFATGAKFISYGCNQGDFNGLCRQLSSTSIWDIRCVGSRLKTDFVPIGRGDAYPSSGGGWVVWEHGVELPGTVQIKDE